MESSLELVIEKAFPTTPNSFFLFIFSLFALFFSYYLNFNVYIVFREPLCV